MKQLPTLLVTATALLMCGLPAFAQSDGYLSISGANPPPLLELTEDGTLIFDGDVDIACEDVGCGIVMTGADSRARTRTALERMNGPVIAMCTEVGFPPSGTHDVALPNAGGVSLARLAVALDLIGYILVRRATAP